MARGTIKSLHVQPGFGFIAPDEGGPDVFFHQTAVLGLGFAHLREGQRVEYDRRVDPVDRQRVRALQVRPIED
jgi:cold shock CspA family protein